MPVSPLPEPKKSGFLSTIRGAVDSLLNIPRTITTKFGQQTQVPSQPNINPTPTPNPFQPYLDKGWKMSADSAPISQPARPMQRPVQQQPMQQGQLARNPNFAKFNPQQQVIDAITQAAQQYGLPPSLLFDIALQESSFDPSLINRTPDGISAGTPQGLFQFTDPTWKTVQNYGAMQGNTLKLPNNDRLDPLTNALAAAYLISKGQLGRWDASKNVWGQHYTDEELKPYYAQTLSKK